jgi:predicted outer membrane repeat protein
VTNNTFTNNHADDDGGAFYVEGRAIITGNRITANSSDDDGGAVYLDDETDPVPTVISGNTFASNVSGYWGGAIAADEDVSLRVISNIFTNNVAYREGGAIFTDGDDDIDVTYVIDKNTFIGNSSTIRSGGAMYIDDITFPGSSITNNLLDGNRAAMNGGGMYIDFDSNLNDFKVVIASNRILRNTAANGAGLYMGVPSGAPLRQQATGVVRNTFERNVASNNGGAIMMEYYGNAYRDARAALQSLQKATRNNRYVANKANGDRGTGTIGGAPVAVVMITSLAEKVDSVDGPEAE